MAKHTRTNDAHDGEDDQPDVPGSDYGRVRREAARARLQANPDAIMTRPMVYESKSGMSAVEGLVHALMIVCTCGLWYPLYRARKHAADRTTTTYAI